MAVTRMQCALLYACAMMALPLAYAQNDATSSTTSSGMPNATDDAQGSNSSSDNSNGSTSTSSLVNYYFVFLALIACVAGLGIFLIWRRRTRAVAYTRYSRQHALARDVSGWQNDGAGHRGGHRTGYRGALWGRSTEDVAAREEGLNELGEAPPAYMPPKTREEEERERQAAQGREPAMPMQTLSREDAGLKPPDYAETSVQPVHDTARLSPASASRTGRDMRNDGSGQSSSS